MPGAARPCWDRCELGKESPALQGALAVALALPVGITGRGAGGAAQPGSTLRESNAKNASSRPKRAQSCNNTFIVFPCDFSHYRLKKNPTTKHGTAPRAPAGAGRGWGGPRGAAAPSPGEPCLARGRDVGTMWHRVTGRGPAAASMSPSRRCGWRPRCPW